MNAEDPSRDRKRAAWLGGAALALLVAAFFAGRYSNPTQVEERTKIQTVTVEKQVVVTQEKVRVERVIVEKVVTKTRVVEHETTSPDGRVEKSREEFTDAATDTRSHTDKASTVASTARAERSQEATAQTERVVTFALPRWRVGVTAGVAPFDAWRPVYGGEAGVRVVGPFWVGVSVRTDGSASAGLALEF